MPQTEFLGSFPTADFHLPHALPEIAFIGRSNVGKSSLLNALVGRRALARTSRTPGQTRACNVFTIDNRYYCVDLPGYGWARVSRVERRGLATLLRDYITTRDAAGLVWLLDLKREPSVDDLAMVELLDQRSLPVLLTLTKADQVARGQWRERVEAILTALGLPLAAEQCVVTSARTGEGIVALRQAIERLMAGG